MKGIELMENLTGDNKMRNLKKIINKGIGEYFGIKPTESDENLAEFILEYIKENIGDDELVILDKKTAIKYGVLN